MADAKGIPDEWPPWSRPTKEKQIFTLRVWTHGAVPRLPLGAHTGPIGLLVLQLYSLGLLGTLYMTPTKVFSIFDHHVMERNMSERGMFKEILKDYSRFNTSLVENQLAHLSFSLKKKKKEKLINWKTIFSNKKRKKKKKAHCWNSIGTICMLMCRFIL